MVARVTPTNFPRAFRLKARAKLPEPERCLLHLVEHLKDRDGDIRAQGDAFAVTLPDIYGWMWCEDGLLQVDVGSRDAETAYFVRTWLDGVFRHLAGTETVEIEWKENWSAGRLPPSFSILKVERLDMLTSQMVRITLKCPDVTRFDRTDALHVQVLVNFAEVTASTGEESPPLAWRRYTVRAVDVARQTIDIDVFLHGGGGLGARWVSQLRVGDLVGVAGPSGGSIGLADHYLIAGDETAIPAIARILDFLPRQCGGDVLIEIANDAERLPLELPDGFKLTWLARQDDTASALEGALISALAHKAAEKTFVWVSCEASIASRLRKHARAAAERDHFDHLIAGYWKR